MKWTATALGATAALTLLAGCSSTYDGYASNSYYVSPSYTGYNSYYAPYYGYPYHRYGYARYGYNYPYSRYGYSRYGYGYGRYGYGGGYGRYATR